MLTVDGYMKRNNETYDRMANVQSNRDGRANRFFIPAMTIDQAFDMIGESDAETIREVLK